MKNKRVLYYLFFLFGVYTFPFILWGVPYRDDLVRSIIPQGWIGDGRFLTEILFRIFSLGSTPLNLFPLMQVLSIPCFAISGFLIYRRFLSHFPPFLASLIIFLLLGHPFYLENMSFQYDALSMNLAVLLSILAFFKARSKGSFLLGAVCLLMALFFYEPVITLFMGLCFLDILYTFAYKEGSSENLILSLFICGIMGLVVYEIFGLSTQPFLSHWALSHKGWIFFASPQEWQKYTKVWQSYLGPVQKYLGPHIGVILGSIVGIFLFWILYCWFFLKKKLLKTPTSKNSCFLFLLVFLSPFLFVGLLLAPLILLKNPILTPRMLVGFGMLFLYIVIGFRKFFLGKWKCYTSWGIYLSAFFFLYLSFAYNYVRKEHVRFEEFLTSHIIRDLKELNKIEYIHNLWFVGKEPYEKEVYFFLKKNPFVIPMFPQYLNDHSPTWTFVYLRHFPILPIFEPKNISQEEKKTFLQGLKNLSPVEDEPLYQLKIFQDTVVIYWKNVIFGEKSLFKDEL